jgi:hypothetical protein
MLISVQEYSAEGMILLGAAMIGIMATSAIVRNHNPDAPDHNARLGYKLNVGRYPHRSMSQSEVAYATRFFYRKSTLERV